MVTKLVKLDKEINEIIVEEDCELVGLYQGKGKDELKSKLIIKHTKPNINSSIKIKATLEDEANFDLEGDLVINKGAKNTNTYLKIDVLLLSDKAKARVVPSLEIMEDEVKAGHGATVGEIDETQIFYLMSRGLNKSEATQELVKGFIKEITDKINTK